MKMRQYARRSKQRGLLDPYRFAASYVGPLDAYTANLWSAVSVNCLFGSVIGGSPLKSYDTTSATTHDALFRSSGILDVPDLLTFGGAHSQNVHTLNTQINISGHSFDGSAVTARFPAIVNAGSYLGNVQFDGTSDGFNTSSSSGSVSAFTVFLRGKLRATTAQVFIELGSNYNSAEACVVYYDAGALSVGVHDNSPAGYSRSDFSGAYPNDNVHCYRFDRAQVTSAAMTVLFIDGVKQTRSGNGDSGTLPTGSFTGAIWNLGARNTAGSVWAQLNVHTLLIYEASLSDADCTAISNILGALPSDDLTVDLDYASVTLGLHADGANNAVVQTDSSRYARGLVPVGNAVLSTTQKKYGTASMYFDGSGDYWLTDATILWFGSSDFTIKGIYNADTFPPSGATNDALIGNYGVSGSRGCDIYVSQSGTMTFRWSTDGINQAGSVDGPSAIVTGTWYEWEVCRVGNTIRLFIGGVSGTSQSITGAIYSPSTPTTIGNIAEVVGAWYLNGYLDELRVWNGVGKHSANYTPRTSAHPDTTGSALSTLYETWGVTSSMTLSNSDKTAAETTALSPSVMGRFSNSSNWYCELTVSASGTFNCAVGIRRCDEAASSNFAQGKTVSVRSSGTTHIGTTGATAGTGTSFATTNVLGLVWNNTTKKLFIHKNGTYMNSGDPVAGTGQMFSGVPNEGWQPYFGADNDAGGSHTVVANFGASAFAYSVPSGYTSGVLA